MSDTTPAPNADLYVEFVWESLNEIGMAGVLTAEQVQAVANHVARCAYSIADSAGLEHRGPSEADELRREMKRLQDAADHRERIYREHIQASVGKRFHVFIRAGELEITPAMGVL